LVTLALADAIQQMSGGGRRRPLLPPPEVKGTAGMFLWSGRHYCNARGGFHSRHPRVLLALLHRARTSAAAAAAAKVGAAAQ